MEVELGEVTVRAGSATGGGDRSTPEVMISFHVRTNGVVVTNWTASPLVALDATGNYRELSGKVVFTNGWSVYRGSRILDPRSVWKLEMDVGPAFDFPPRRTNEFQVQVPLNLPKPLTTNICGVPVEFSWTGQRELAVRMPTNAVSWRFRDLWIHDVDSVLQMEMMGYRNIREGVIFFTGNPLAYPSNAVPKGVAVTLAIAPNIHAEFMVQPKLLSP
jgi:hypothetical protein